VSRRCGIISVELSFHRGGTSSPLRNSVAVALVVYFRAQFGYRMALAATVGLRMLPHPVARGVPGGASAGTRAAAKTPAKIGFGRPIRQFLIRVFSRSLATFYWVCLPQFRGSERELPMSMLALLSFVRQNRRMRTIWLQEPECRTIGQSGPATSKALLPPQLESM
jgi:hypothetical protein